MIKLSPDEILWLSHVSLRGIKHAVGGEVKIIGFKHKNNPNELMDYLNDPEMPLPMNCTNSVAKESEVKALKDRIVLLEKKIKEYETEACGGF